MPGFQARINGAGRAVAIVLSLALAGCSTFGGGGKEGSGAASPLVSNAGTAAREQAEQTRSQQAISYLMAQQQSTNRRLDELDEAVRALRRMGAEDGDSEDGLQNLSGQLAGLRAEQANLQRQIDELEQKLAQTNAAARAAQNKAEETRRLLDLDVSGLGEVRSTAEKKAPEKIVGSAGGPTPAMPAQEKGQSAEATAAQPAATPSTDLMSDTPPQVTSATAPGDTQAPIGAQEGSGTAGAPVTNPAPAQTASQAADAQRNDTSGDDEQGDDDAYALHVASFREMEASLRGWNELRRRYPDLLGQMRGRVDLLDLADYGGRFFRLKIGPLPDAAAAGRLCTQLEAEGEYCEVTRFDGQDLPETMGG